MQGIENARNGKCKENASFSQVWKMQGTDNARNHLRNCSGWKMQGMENARKEINGKMQGTENAKNGKCKEWKMQGKENAGKHLPTIRIT